jgi:hypothetical protein
LAWITPILRLAHLLHLEPAMGAFEDLLRRQGYVKLDHYGLVLTPDDRILSTRPAVLDDGLGGKIVGWADGDLAAAELDHWCRPAKPAPAKRVAATTGLHSVPPPPIPRAASPATTTVSKRAVVAAEPVVEEDEWEWEIAMARARAVADDVQTSAATIATSVTAPRATPKRTMQHGVVAPVLATGTSPAAKQPAVVKSAVHSTVIPVPSLPVATQSKPSQVRPTVHTLSSPPPLTAQQARTRLARGTQPTAHSEDTVVTAVVQPAVHDDHTAPYLMLPAEVKSTGFAHTRRVATK